MEIRRDMSPAPFLKPFLRISPLWMLWEGYHFFSDGKVSERLVRQRNVFRDRETDHQRSMVGE